jgi:tight adherence protein B
VIKRFGTRLLAVALVLLAVPSAFAAGSLQLTPVGRLPFPERGYIVDLPKDEALGRSAVRVSENGSPVRELSVSPVAASGLNVGVVLAIDASESMTGRPFEAALSSARTFVAHRGAGERIGLLAFNSAVQVLQQPTLSGHALAAALKRPPALAHGTRIYDVLDRALTMLAQAKVSAGSILLLSDGSDLGSQKTFAAVLAQAQGQHVRIFTVGLRSGAFDPTALQSLAQQSGGAYAEAASAAQLQAIYEGLGERLAREYLVQYRSTARPKSHVVVRISVSDLGDVSLAYTAPKPSGLAPFHRSFGSRLLLSPASVVLLSLLVAWLVAFLLRKLLRGTPTNLVGRVNQFVRGEPAAAPERKRKSVRASLQNSPSASGWLAKIERDLEIADINLSAQRVVVLTATATGALLVILALVSPVVAIPALLTPLATRGLIKRKLAKVREQFADQLPTNLAVLASALRAGHGFTGALTVVVENAHEPSHRELQRVLNDDQLGVPMEDAVRRVATRMANRDLEQVALIAELQRTAGGNAAEVLDTVVDTIRERSEIRRLVRNLTVQGRMGRWILTGMPVVVGFFFWLIQPDQMRPLLVTTGGQVALVLAALMVAAGSLVIQRIVDIKV